MGLRGAKLPPTDLHGGNFLGHFREELLHHGHGWAPQPQKRLARVGVIHIVVVAELLRLLVQPVLLQHVELKGDKEGVRGDLSVKSRRP